MSGPRDQLSPAQLRELAATLTPDQLLAALVTVIRVSPGLARNAIEAAMKPAAADDKRAAHIRSIVDAVPRLGPRTIADLDRLLNPWPPGADDGQVIP